MGETFYVICQNLGINRYYQFIEKVISLKQGHEQLTLLILALYVAFQVLASCFHGKKLGCTVPYSIQVYNYV